MSEKSTYKTVDSRCEGLYKEKGSKFIGIAVSCFTEQEAKAFLDGWKKEHHQARHLCYAYRFGLEGEKYRANDDGEPSNSAGAPILGQLQSFDLTNTLIGVVRYYGGTKLGVGGLINAYRTGAKEAIRNGRIVENEVFEWVVLEFEYIDMPKVMGILKKYDLKMIENQFELSCRLKTNLSLNFAAEVKKELKKLESVKLISDGIY